MASRKVTDIDIIRALLVLQTPDAPATGKNVAQYLGLSRSAIHRRLHRLADKGHVRYGARVKDGEPEWIVEPSCLDLVDGFRDGTVLFYWQSMPGKELFIQPAE